ncbi:unnamed protein product, partial [marine sediment metagenome]
RQWAGQQFDPVTRRELVKTGYVGDLWNAAFRITKMATTGQVLIVGDPEFVGVISVRIDLDQMDAPDPDHIRYGWVFYEYIGIAQLTDVGSALLTVTGELATSY